ncbi:hypothetical protein K438DRAFT_1770027 [Mycena galopus ATCC 62051]|nr:hypothetical protein K438DRAFT_1770027 [Mycena galopus ATCC 62051]
MPNDNASALPASSIPKHVRLSTLLHRLHLLQYEVFLGRLHAEMVLAALQAVGIASALQFEAVGGTQQGLVKLLDASEYEEYARIDTWHAVQLTFRALLSITVHLSQVTLAISSIAQLRQLLRDEAERCVEVGGVCSKFLNIRQGTVIHCAAQYAFRLGKTGLQQGDALTYFTDLNVPCLLERKG